MGGEPPRPGDQRRRKGRERLCVVVHPLTDDPGEPFVRLSVGLETVDDLIDDLNQALKAATTKASEPANA